MAYSDNDKKAKLTYLYVYMYLCATLGILYLLQKSIQWPDVIVIVVERISFSLVCGVLPLNGKKFIKTEVCGNALLSVVVVASDGNFFNWAQTRALNILELCRYNKDVTYLIQEIDENIKIKHSYIVYKIFRPSFLMS